MRGDDRVRVEVLGPVRLIDPAGGDITPDGALQRRLVALLVLRRDRVVTVDSLIDVLWPDRPPRDPAAALHNHVSRLRRSVPDGLIESTGDGYRLVASGIDLDVDRLAAAVAAGGEGDGPWSTEIDDALARWRGPAYPELSDVEEGRVESIRLDELRTRAREVRAERRLASSDTDGLVAELTALVDAEPLRERPRALLMEALEASGRHVEALRAFDDFRRLLGDELGIEPSAALAARHAELLAGGGGAPWTPASRLPVPLTSLVGRDDLVAEVTAMVEDHRLVTLVGSGGVGKTRLAIEVGERLRAGRPDRPVVLCELATAVEATAADVIAAALAIDARPGVETIERVAAVLGDRELVVVLDNCEHVLDAVADLTVRLLSRCPNVTVIATSQERLRVPGEQLCPVPSLVVGVAGAPAVQLFVERARAVAPSFEADEHDLVTIAEIVDRLDGLPLAIELAAARLHTHDLGEIAVGLDRRFELLASGYRSSSRHASLHAAVAWSFDLLEPPLQQTFVDLSVFTGSFTAADAAAITGAPEHVVAERLAQLTERSLVVRAPERRFVLLETLRAFGTERLTGEGRADEVGERHAHHQVAWAEGADRRLLEHGSTVLAEIDAAIPELRTALGWLLDHGDVDRAGRLVVALLDYGLLRLRPDVLGWAERIAEADPDDLASHAADVAAVAAYAAWMAGDLDGSGARAAHAVRVAERSGSLPSEVATVMGNHALFEGRLDDATDWYRRASDAAVGDPAQELMTASTALLARAYAGDPEAADAAAELVAAVDHEISPHAAYVWYCAGEADQVVDVERARARFLRAVELAEQTGASFVVGIAGASKASIDARTGDPAQAAADYRRLITHWRRAGMWSTQWTMLRSIASLLERLGRPRDAAVLEGAVRATDSGHRIFGADAVALGELGERLRAALGDDDYRRALQEGAALDGDAAAEHALRAL